MDSYEVEIRCLMDTSITVQANSPTDARRAATLLLGDPDEFLSCIEFRRVRVIAEPVKLKARWPEHAADKSETTQ